MAAENFQPLLSLQNFDGLDFTTAQPLVKDGFGVLASNANPTLRKGALLPEQGRIQMFDFSDSTNGFATLSVVQAIFPVVTALNTPQYLVQGLAPDGVTLRTILYNPALPLGTATTPIGGGLKFNEAIQYGSVVYTNGGQRLFLSDPSNNVVATFYDWQYVPPPVFTGTFTVAPGPVNPPSLAVGYYWYIFTRVTTMPDGSISETSVNLTEFALNASLIAAIQVTTGNSQITITPTGGFLFHGTNDDGTVFNTNIYRQSTNTPGYYLVAKVSTNGPYTDVSRDGLIVQSPLLEVHRDQPPVGFLQGQLAANFGNLAIHKSRAWCFVTIGSPATFGLVQNQIWYSNPGRPWEFDDVAQVLLADSDVTSNTNIATGYVYNAPYGNQPRGLAGIGTVLLAFKQREMWAVLGDDQTNFVARTYFGIGCVAQRSITPAVGGCFWLSENGVYYFDGSAPQYDSESIRNFLRPVPGGPGIKPSDRIASVGWFTNLTYYLSFPTLGFTIGYYTPDGVWTSVLPYAPSTAGAIAYVSANPNAVGATGNDFNEVVGARSSAPAIVDWWFIDPNNDLGKPMTFSWTGPITASKVFGEKQYRYLTLFVPPGTQGSATVTLTIDGVVYPQPSGWVIPDLSVAPRNLQKSLGNAGGELRGFMANLSITATGVLNQPPPQIWDCTVWGQMPVDRKLVLRV